MKKFKSICFGLIATMMMTFLTACGDNAVEPEVKAAAAENGNITQNDEAIKIGVLRIADSLPIYIADSKGFFKECGVNVEVIEFGSASDQSKAMESGAIDGMLTDMVVEMLLKKGGTDLRTVAVGLGAEVPEGRFLVVSNKDAGVGSIDDSEGKTLAISEGTMMEYIVDSYYSELGKDITKVEKVNIPSLALRYESLSAGEVDMAVLPDPLSVLAIEEGGNIIVDDTTLKNNYSISVVAFNKEFLDSNTEDVKKFASAYNKAVDTINNESEENIDLIRSVCNVPDVIKDIWKVQSYSKFTVPTEEETSSVVRWMMDKGLIEKKYEYSEIVDASYCTEE